MYLQFTGLLPVQFRQQDLRQTEDNYYLLYACILCCLSYSNCVFFIMFVSLNVIMYLSLRFFGYLVFGGIMFFVNSTAWLVLRHVRFTGNVHSIQLSVIFVFLIVSGKCMFPLLACTCLSSLVCFHVIFLHLFRSHYSLLIMRRNQVNIVLVIQFVTAVMPYCP